MVLAVARQEDDHHGAPFSHARRIARSAVWRDEKLRLFVLEFERVPEGRPSDDSDDGGGHGGRTKSHRAIKVPSRRSWLGPGAPAKGRRPRGADGRPHPTER